MNAAEENAFTQSILPLSLTNISKNTHNQPLEFKGTGSLRNQKTGYK